jgi:transposase
VENRGVSEGPIGSKAGRRLDIRRRRSVGALGSPFGNHLGAGRAHSHGRRHRSPPQRKHDLRDHRQGEIHFDLFDGTMNSERFIEFLKKLLTDAAGPIFLIIDGVSYHKSKAVMNFVESTEGRLKLFHLPAYSPQLNPDEWVWNNVKNTQIGRKIVTRKSDLANNAWNALQRLKDLPWLVRGFFHDPNLAYILEVH